MQLDDAFSRAEADDEVRVVILAARGKNFSAGHDLGSEEAVLERTPGPDQHPTFRSHGATKAAPVEKLYLQEWHFYFENTRGGEICARSPSPRCRAAPSRPA